MEQQRFDWKPLALEARADDRQRSMSRLEGGL